MNQEAAAASGPVPIEMSGVAVPSLRDQELRVIEELNWTVREGEYWVVAGLQGSGKSDLLMMTAGLMPPARGAYRFFGQPMPIFQEGRLSERLQLGLVFESGQLFNRLTVRENIALPLRYHHNLTMAAAEPEVQRMLAAMELEPWAQSTPGALGRNWQKRVALARALMLKPKVLLVDGPLTGLDLRHVHWWRAMLDQLAQGHELCEGRPLTLVVSAADLRPWKGRACRFAAIRDRRFTVLGTWEQLEAETSELVNELLMTEARGS